LRESERDQFDGRKENEISELASNDRKTRDNSQNAPSTTPNNVIVSIGFGLSTRPEIDLAFAKYREEVTAGQFNVKEI
jgi:hypothetical protein